MATVNLILQGKGGVGKSAVAALIAQYLIERGASPILIDTDPVNSTFAGYKSMNVETLSILDDENEINIRAFDTLIEKINSAGTAPLVIDNGASSFVPLMSYIIQNDIPAFLDEMGHKIVVHSVVTGGQAFIDTLSGFIQSAQQFPSPASFVVWENPFWGDVLSNEGQPLEKLKAFHDVRERIELLVKLPKLKAALSGQDFADMLKNRQTFQQAINGDSLPIIVRHRLKQVRDNIFGQLDQGVSLFGLEEKPARAGKK